MTSRVARGSLTPGPSQNRTGASRLIRLLSPGLRRSDSLRAVEQFLPLRVDPSTTRFGSRLRPVGELLPRTGLTARRDWVIGPLRSMPITGTSTLLRAHPPLCLASVLRPSWDLHLGFSLHIEATGSQVPRSSQDRTHATLMPDATLAVSGYPQRSSRSNDYSPVSASSLRFRHVVSGSLAFVFPIPT
jgi:hypothetical protein